MAFVGSNAIIRFELYFLFINAKNVPFILLFKFKLKTFFSLHCFSFIFAITRFRCCINAEGLFSAANIFSSLKLVYIFSVNPHLGPLQVSLSRMVMDIIKFFFLYVLVLFAFSSGLNQLLW